MAGVQKVRLNHLNINIKNGLIIGIIIAKNSPRTVGSKKKNGDSRGVTSFTIRDSDVDTINVDVWGSEYFVLTFYERFLVGDVDTRPTLLNFESVIKSHALVRAFSKYANIRPNVLNSTNVHREHFGALSGVLVSSLCFPSPLTQVKAESYLFKYTWNRRDSYIEAGKFDLVHLSAWKSSVNPLGYHCCSCFLRYLLYKKYIAVEITSPKICVKTGDNETYRPQVSSPFYLSLNEGMSDVSIHSGDAFSMYLPLLHMPTKQSSGYYGLAEVMKLQDESNNFYVDLLVVVKSVKPAKTIKTKAGVDMSVRGVEIIDNTTPASINLDIFDIDTIQRAEEWRPLESVLFIADARVSWRARAVSVQVCARTVITHQPHTADAEALRLHIRNQASARGGEAAAWAAWSGERSCAASVSQVRDRVAGAAPFCASLHALLTHLDLDELDTLDNNTDDNIRVRFADHTGELTARLPVNVLEDTLGYSIDQLKAMPAENRAAARWGILLEQCTVKLAASPPRLIVLTLRRTTQADPIPLY